MSKEGKSRRTPKSRVMDLEVFGELLAREFGGRPELASLDPEQRRRLMLEALRAKLKEMYPGETVVGATLDRYAAGRQRPQIKYLDQLRRVLCRTPEDELRLDPERKPAIAIEPVASMSPPRFPQAFTWEHGTDPLRRLFLDSNDFTSERAVKPRLCSSIVEALKGPNSVALEGPPGSGKSGLAAWVNWCLVREHGVEVHAFRPEDFADVPLAQSIARLESVDKEVILLIDDVHKLLDLIAEAHRRLPGRRYFLIGRTGSIRQNPRVPPLNFPIFEIKTGDTRDTAERLADAYRGTVDEKALKAEAAGSLITMKALLDANIKLGLKSGATDAQAAGMRLNELCTRNGKIAPELLRYVVTLASFQALELWCPVRPFLYDTLGFDLDVLEPERYELSRESAVEAPTSSVVRLTLHAQDCRRMVEAGPTELTDHFAVYVRERTLSELRLPPEKFPEGDHPIEAIVLAAALRKRVITATNFEAAVVSAGRRKDRFIERVYQIALAMEPEHAESQPRSEDDATRQLTYVYGIANEMRRFEGGIAARAESDRLCAAHGLGPLPLGLFDDRGFIEYQRAYLAQLNNEPESALAGFEDSARSDYELARSRKGRKVHFGKAIMSRLVAHAYRLNLALFTRHVPGRIEPDRDAIRRIAGDLERWIEELERLIASKLAPDDERATWAFLGNAVTHWLHALGWLGDRDAVARVARRFDQGVLASDRNVKRGREILAPAALALIAGEYDLVAKTLELVFKEDQNDKAFEFAGRHAAMLMVAYDATGQHDRCEQVRSWLFHECHEDRANGPAHRWARGEALDPVDLFAAVDGAVLPPGQGGGARPRIAGRSGHDGRPGRDPKR